MSPELRLRLREAVEHYAALSPLEKARANIRQQQSWIRGEMALGLDDGKGVSRGLAETLSRRSDAVVILDEMERLEAQLAALAHGRATP